MASRSTSNIIALCGLVVGVSIVLAPVAYGNGDGTSSDYMKRLAMAQQQRRGADPSWALAGLGKRSQARPSSPVWGVVGLGKRGGKMDPSWAMAGFGKRASGGKLDPMWAMGGLGK